MRKLIFGLVLVATYTLGANEVLAQCCCMDNVSTDIRGSRYATASEELKSSDAVFYGQVVELKMIGRKPAREGGNNYEVEITFRVEKAWRRDLKEFVTLREYSHGCLIGFGIADRWLVYANFDEENNLRTGYCTRSRSADRNVEKDFREFEKNGEAKKKVIKASIRTTMPRGTNR